MHASQLPFLCPSPEHVPPAPRLAVCGLTRARRDYWRSPSLPSLGPNTHRQRRVPPQGLPPLQVGITLAQGLWGGVRNGTGASQEGCFQTKSHEELFRCHLAFLPPNGHPVDGCTDRGVQGGERMLAGCVLETGQPSPLLTHPQVLRQLQGRGVPDAEGVHVHRG